MDKDRNIQYSGELVYNNNATIEMSLYDPPPVLNNVAVGTSFPGSAGTTATEYTETGYIVRSDMQELALDNVHELIHQGVGATHPTDKNNPAKDVALTKV
jgi:hypothetical protein